MKICSGLKSIQSITKHLTKTFTPTFLTTLATGHSQLKACGIIFAWHPFSVFWMRHEVKKKTTNTQQHIFGYSDIFLQPAKERFTFQSSFPIGGHLFHQFTVLQHCLTEVSNFPASLLQPLWQLEGRQNILWIQELNWNLRAHSKAASWKSRMYLTPFKLSPKNGEREGQHPHNFSFGIKYPVAYLKSHEALFSFTQILRVTPTHSVFLFFFSKKAD